VLFALGLILALQPPTNPSAQPAQVEQPSAVQPEKQPAPKDQSAPSPQPIPSSQPPKRDPLDDASAPVQGDLSLDVETVNRDLSNWAGIPPDKEWLNFLRDPLKKLDDETGLLISGAYTVLFQQALGENTPSGAAGDFDLTGRWNFIGKGTKDVGTVFFSTEYRHAIGYQTPSELGPELGTLIGTTNSFNERGWAVKDVYYVQRLFDDRFRFGVGRIDPENLVATLRLQSANTSFLNKAFSSNPTIAYPGIGAGATAMVKPVDWLYIGGGFNNAYGSTTNIEVDKLFDEWRLFEYGEVGVTPKIEGAGEGRYKVSYWHMDSRSLTNKPSDEGFSIVADQDLGEKFSVFARYGYSDAELTNVRQMIEAGCAIEGLFGITSDLTGFGLAWAQPPGGGRDEKIFEVFHRFQLTGRTQFTLGGQLILDPSNAPDVDTLGVLSVRLRLTF
jgi:hypothetical protein